MNHEPSIRDFMPGGSADAEGIARAGAPLPAGTTTATEEAVIEALKTVHDPEIPVNIYDLGLIYGIERFDDGDVRIEMTLTAPACPVAGEMPVMVAKAVAGTPGVGEVEVQLVWEPSWNPRLMSEEARLLLDMF